MLLYSAYTLTQVVLVPNPYILLFVAVLSAGSTWQIQNWHYGKIIAESKNQQWNNHLQAVNTKIELDREAQAKEQELLELQEVKKQKNKVHTKIVTKEVIKYVQNPNAGKLIIPTEWVRIHDTAAIGPEYLQGDPVTTAEPNASASKITDIDALEIVTDNYVSYHEIYNQLIDLQEWVRLQCK